jgi:hypothetical protein
MKQGDMVSCDSCMRARPIQNPVVELFGSQIGFGPAGETDMFVKEDDKITCYHCMEKPDEYIDAKP